jgi:hypothetical protein
MTHNLNAYDHMLYAALMLVEAQDAGRDTTLDRDYYDRCRATYEAERAATDAMLADVLKHS